MTVVGGLVVLFCWRIITENFWKDDAKEKINKASIMNTVWNNNLKNVATGNNNTLTYIKEQKIYMDSKNKSDLPSADEITSFGRRALWSNEYLGSREAYYQLLNWKNAIMDPKTSQLISAEIKRVEDDYRTDIMRGNIDTWSVICKSHAIPSCSKGMENSEGFLAGNVITHLDPHRRMDERARAACILRNIKTAPDKDSVNKEDFYKKLVGLMGEKENSLCVSKMALETYKDLTGFSSDGVFDFESAIKDWEKRKDEILKADF